MLQLFKVLHRLIILYIKILVFAGSGLHVGVCGCAIPRWNRLGTHMNVRPELSRPNAPHARNWQKCVSYYIRQKFSVNLGLDAFLMLCNA